MNEKKQNWVMDMTEGNITKILLQFTVPLLIGNLFQQVYNIVDSVVVGRYLGAKALGGVGSVGMISFLFFSLCLGLSNGIGVNIANAYGNKEYEKLKQMIANAFYIMVAAGILMSILGFCFAKPILLIMNTPFENFHYAYTYMKITCGLTITVALYNGISSILRALGDSKTPLIFLAISSVLNVILDIIFVIHCNYGVAGAAYATVISQFLSAIGSIVFAVRKNPYFSLKKEHFILSKELIAENLKIGIPMSIQTALISISCALLQTLINGFGTSVMAAYTATGKIENVIFQPFNSLGAAVSTFAGQNLGAGNYDRIKKAAWKSELMVLAFSAALFVIILFFNEEIIHLFVEDSEVIAIGAKGLLITGSAYFALGSIYIFRGILNGMKDVTFSMINGGLEVGGRVVFALILMYMTSIGYLGIWYTNILTWILIAGSAMIRFVYFIRRAHSA